VIYSFLKRLIKLIDWKSAYNGRWKDGKNRAEKIIDQLPHELYNIKPYGFLTNSIEYSKDYPTENGIPDYEVTILKNNFRFLLETTGTKSYRENIDVWVRNDKFEFAERHQEIECWVGHIIEDENLVRFFKLEAKEDFNLESRMIRGLEERFRIIPSSSKKLLNSNEFLDHLEFLSWL